MYMKCLAKLENCLFASCIRASNVQRFCVRGLTLIKVLLLFLSPLRQDSVFTAGEQKAIPSAGGVSGGGVASKKRLARSRIPSNPVVMPGGVESLDLEVRSSG